MYYSTLKPRLGRFPPASARCRVAAIIFSAALILSGCSSARYGHSPEEWNGMTQNERDEIRQQAETTLHKTREKEREKDFNYQSIDAIFGTRSNEY